ncbi:MAG: hypothetical protein U0871_21550 [Gemmataceae bacterium]
MRVARLTAAAVAVAGLLAGGPARAGIIVSTTGPLTINPSPAGLNLNNGNAPGSFAFNERGQVTVVAGSVSVDTLVSTLAAGLVNAKGGSAGNLPAGVYDSALIHFDQAPGAGNPSLTASITFSDPIVGIIFSTSRLNNTDGTFGLPGVTYPTGAGGTARGLEGGDGLRISADRRTLFIDDWDIAGALDQTRVITLHTPAPAGAVLAVLGLPALGLLRTRRKATA